MSQARGAGGWPPFAPFDELVGLLRERRRDAEADELHGLLHGVAWTSALEMWGELGHRLQNIRKGTPEPDRPVRDLLERCFEPVRRAWPWIG